MRKLLALALAGGLLAPAACTHRGQSAVTTMGGDATTMVTVQNMRFYDMNVFVVNEGGTRVRLGTVTGNSSGRFTIPSYLVGTGTVLRFIADPIGPSGVSRSEELQVRPGDAVQLSIQP